MTNKGNIISELRKEAGYTQKTLANALHITDKAVSKWERGLSLPDVSLLPKLSLLLGADLALLLAPVSNHPNEGWKGLIDLRKYEIPLDQVVYDKPLVYYVLSHYLLSGVREISFLCSDRNKHYLEQPLFTRFGFSFSFPSLDNLSAIESQSLMITNRPVFLFGSDLTRHFQGAMVSESLVKLVPESAEPAFLFCPAEYGFMYFKNPDYLNASAATKTLGRGMVCIELMSPDTLYEAASFVKIYQKNSGMLIGSLEEIAFNKGIISAEEVSTIAESVSYGRLLVKVIERSASKPIVG